MKSLRFKSITTLVSAANRILSMGASHYWLIMGDPHSDHWHVMKDGDPEQSSTWTNTQYRDMLRNLTLDQKYPIFLEDAQRHCRVLICCGSRFAYDKAERLLALLSKTRYTL